MSTKLSGYNKKAIFYANHTGAIYLTKKLSISCISFCAFLAKKKSHLNIKPLSYTHAAAATEKEGDCRMCIFQGKCFIIN